MTESTAESHQGNVSLFDFPTYMVVAFALCPTSGRRRVPLPETPPEVLQKAKTVTHHRQQKEGLLVHVRVFV